MAREQICLASRIIEAGLAIEIWKTNEEHALETAAKALAEARYGTIIERIKALGWDPKWFPTGDMGDSEDFEAWNGYLHQPKQFNARGWNMIRPKAEAIYLRSKQRHQTHALLEAVVSVYKERRSALPLQQRREMPGCSDVVFDSRLEVFLSENHALDWTDSDIESMATTLLSDSSEFHERLQQKLIKDLWDVGLLSSLDGSHDGIRPSEARLLYFCPHCCLKHQPYQDIVEHFEGHHPKTPLTSGSEMAEVLIDPGFHRSAGDILAALGLPRNAARDKVDALGLLVCRCGHHVYGKPTSFDKLVEHVHTEQMWYRNATGDILESQRDLAQHILVDSHRADLLSGLIGIAAPDEDNNPNSRHDIDGMLMPFQEQFGCSWCYRIARNNPAHLAGLRNETREYHMRVKHGKALSLVGDFKPWATLREKYPRDQMGRR